MPEYPEYFDVILRGVYERGYFYAFGKVTVKENAPKKFKINLISLTMTFEYLGRGRDIQIITNEGGPDGTKQQELRLTFTGDDDFAIINPSRRVNVTLVVASNEIRDEEKKWSQDFTF
jgi:hypothetical protein